MGDFDEYDYLEKAVEGTEIRKDKDRKSSRHHDKDANGEKRDDRARSDRRDKEKDRDQRRDREKDRDGEREREREKEKERDHRSRDRDYKERDRDREKEKVRDREKEKEREREKERESSRRSSSRSRLDREAEREMERARSRERALREREMEREMRERESRRFKEKKEAGEPEADPERDQRTVFAYQMPLKATERDVYEFFSKAGKVRDVRLIMDRNSRRSKGVGYIEFYDSMPVPMAIALSGQLLFGQPVMVKPSEAEKNLVQSTSTGGSGLLGAGAAKKIYVGNLHFNITEDQLRQELSTYRCNSVFCKIDSFQLHHSIPQVFEPFGPVELVQLPVDMETGQCKGYGFIQFAQIEHAKAAQSLNGKLDIAGRVIKVSAVTDHVPVQETGTNVADFDDDDGGGLSLNARSRAMLMQKLDRTGTASSIAESLGVAPANQQQLSLPVNGQATVAAALLTTPFTMPIAAPIGEPSECVLLTNMFDPRTETEPDFDLDIKEDVHEECSKFGLVKHIYVDKHSSGHVYLRFDTVTAAASCQRTMHMRFFAGNRISATFMRPQEYDAKFSSGA